MATPDAMVVTNYPTDSTLFLVMDTTKPRGGAPFFDLLLFVFLLLWIGRVCSLVGENTTPDHRRDERARCGFIINAVENSEHTLTNLLVI